VARSFVNELLEDCCAKGKVLLLDCCFSGAFAQGFKAAPGAALDGQLGEGYLVMTATDEYEYAFEEDSMSLDSPRVSISPTCCSRPSSPAARIWTAMDGSERTNPSTTFMTR